MSQRIETAAVLGSGVMGSAIAAHLAGAGIKTHLLDIVPPNLSDDEKNNSTARNQIAAAGLKAALKAKPAAFFDPDAARLIRTGNLDDDLEHLKDCDLIIEAVIERMDIKKSLFAKIEPHLKDTAILASNTSGLKISEMSEGLSDAVQERFMVMHFFNPVRYMRLLELVPGPKTSPAVMEAATRFGEFLGKGIVLGKDTPNFVANRIGVYSMMQAFRTMDECGLTIEEVDKIAGKPMGRPKSAAFRTADVVGIDTFVKVAKTCYDNLPDDPERDVFNVAPWVQTMVEQGKIGQKAKQGFYKKVGKDILVIDPETLEYREQKKVRFDSIGAVRGIEKVGPRIKALLQGKDAAADFAWKCTARTLCYSARLLGEIADDVVSIDRAMKWGFNWDMGPFEAWDAIGVEESVARMKEDGLEVPEWVSKMLESGRKSFYDGGLSSMNFYNGLTGDIQAVPFDEKHIRIAALKEDKKNIVKENMGASLVDLGDGILCLEVHTKMNTIDPDVVKMMNEAVEIAEKDYRGLVIANDGEHFGAGANIFMVLMSANMGAFDQVDTMVAELQAALQRFRFCSVPVVAAPHSLTLGGGAEIAMAADACHAYAETYMGLVEVGVGLVPAGGGCLRTVERYTDGLRGIPGIDPLKFLGVGMLNIATAKVGTGAEETRKYRYLRPDDGMCLNRDHLIYEAKHKAIGMAEGGYRPPRPRTFKAAGIDAAQTMAMQAWSMMESGYASEHDRLIASKVAYILCGGNVPAGTVLTEQDYLDLEREVFVELVKTEKTRERIQFMLQNNKPLRN